MTSHTTWKNRGIRAAVALAVVALLALWLLIYSAGTALAKEYLPSPWDGIVQWGLLALVVFLCSYFTTTPGRRGRRKARAHFHHREPTPSDRASTDDLWYAVDNDGNIREAFIQTGRRRKPQWMPHYNVYTGARLLDDNLNHTLVQYRQTRGHA